MALSSPLKLNIGTYHHQLNLKNSVDVIYQHLKIVPLGYWQFFTKLLLVLWLSFSLAHLFWLVLPSPTIHDAVANVQTPSSDTDVANISPVDIKKLKALHVFGKADAQMPESIPVVSMPTTETHLSLVLVGVIASNLEQMAHAIISADSKQELYKVGAALPAGEGVKLLKVLKDRVIINNNGQSEFLFLDENNPSRKSLGATNTTLMSREESQKMLEWQADHAEPETAPTHYRPTVSLPDQAITAMERSMSNIVNINSFKEDGKLAGFKISPGRDIDKFKELGLQPNDVITAINGWPMNDPAQILDMYQNLGDSGSASVQIKRGTNVISVDIALQ